MEKASLAQNHTKLWSNVREQPDDKEEKQTEDNSRVRGVESQLKLAAQRG